MDIRFLSFLLRASVRNLWRSPRRTIFSLLAIAASAGALLVFQSFVDGVKSTFRQNVITSRYGHYQIVPKNSGRGSLQDKYSKLITDTDKLKSELSNKFSDLTFFGRQLSLYGLLTIEDRSAGGQGLGVDPAEERKFLTLTQVHEGKHLAESGPEGIFMGVGLARKLGAKVGERVTIVVTTIRGSINAVDLELVGTFSSGVTELDENFFYLHFDAVESLIGVKGAERVLIGFDSKDELIYGDDLRKTIETTDPNLEAVHWEKLAAYFANTMGWLEAMFVVVRAIVLLIAALSIANVFMITLLERIGEFGTLRAIGTKRSEINLMIFTEAFMQALIGTVMGIAMSIFVITLVLKNGIKMPPPLMMSVPFDVRFAVPWSGMLKTGLLCMIVTALAGVLPAFKISRMNIVQALGRNI